MDSEKKLTLTEEWLRDKARSYVPLKEKREFVELCAMKCFDRMEIGTEDGQPLPPFYKENAVSKQKYMTGALLRLYLGVVGDFGGEDDPYRMTDEAFDEWARCFPVSQIERMKRTTKDKELQDKIYDLLADYKSLEKLLNAECYGLLPAMNDTLSRFQMMMSAQTTPEVMAELQKTVEQTQRELEAFKTGQG